MLKADRIFLAWIVLASAQISSGQYYVASTVAGNGQTQIQGIGGPAVSATLISPRYVATDTAGNVFVSDNYYHQVFRISLTGTITVAAGTGRQGFSGDGGPATAAQLDTPSGVAVDTAGNLYIADSNNGRVRRVTPAGEISTVATIVGASNIAVSPTGVLFVSQLSGHTIQQVRADGTISLFAGTGTAGFAGDDGPAIAARLFQPLGLALDAAGNLFVADSGNRRVRRITPGGIISTVAGNGNSTFAGDGGPALAAAFAGVADVAVDAANNLYVVDSNAGRLRRVNNVGVITTLAGGGTSSSDGTATQTTLPGIAGVALDSQGNVFLVAGAARQVRRLRDGQITTLAGVLPSGTAGSNVQATSVGLLRPSGVTVDASGTLFLSDVVDNRVRRVASTGIITTVVGNGIFGGANGSVAVAQIGAPIGLAFDAPGNLFIAASAGSAIRKLTLDGLVSTVAGGAGSGFAGDGQAATAAFLSNRFGIATDVAGNIYVADTNNNRIRRVDAVTGIMTTIAGGATASYSGDDGPATASLLFQPRRVAVDRTGNIYVADSGNSRVRRITPAGIISTVAGTGTGGFSGDGGPATSANLVANAIAVDAAGNLFVASSARVRKVTAATGIITTIAGNGSVAFAGDGALATSASFDTIEDITVDASGNIYLADAGNWRIRKLTPAQIVSEGVANGGTLRAGAVAPGEIISIFGFDLGPSSPLGVQLDGAGKVATQAGGTQVFFDGVAAPLLYVSPGQVNAVVPYSVTGPTTRLQVVYQGRQTNTITLPVAASSPGIFAITNQDGSVNTAANRAATGSVLILYATGEGQTSPAGIDGNVANTVFPAPILPVTIQIGGSAGEILYAGAAPGFVSGVLQVNVRIPTGVTGTVLLQLRIGNATTPTGINVSVR